MQGSGDPARDPPSGTERRKGADFALYPPRARKGLDPLRLDDFTARLDAFRRRVEELRDPRGESALHLLDLDLIRRRFGRRFGELRENIFQIIEHALDRALGAQDLYVVVDETTIYALTCGWPREEARLRLRLAAAHITERLCGVVPGGAAIRVTSLAFPFDRELRGVAGLAALRARVEAFLARARKQEEEAFRLHADRLRPRLEPLIQPRKGLIGAYLLDGWHEREDGRLEPAVCLCPDRFEGAFDAALDTWRAERLAERLADWRRVAGRSLLVVPVHFDTLARRRDREPYLQRLRRLPQHSARVVVFELLDAPPGVPQGYLHQLLMYLKPFALALAVRLAPLALSTEAFAQSGVRFVSMPAKAPRGEEPRALVQRLARTAREAGMRSALVEVEETGWITAARDSGVDHLAGPLIAPPLPQPLPRGRRALWARTCG